MGGGGGGVGVGSAGVGGGVVVAGGDWIVHTHDGMNDLGLGFWRGMDGMNGPSR